MGRAGLEPATLGSIAPGVSVSTESPRAKGRFNARDSASASRPAWAGLVSPVLPPVRRERGLSPGGHACCGHVPVCAASPLSHPITHQVERGLGRWLLTPYDRGTSSLEGAAHGPRVRERSTTLRRFHGLTRLRGRATRQRPRQRTRSLAPCSPSHSGLRRRVRAEPRWVGKCCLPPTSLAIGHWSGGSVRGRVHVAPGVSQLEAPRRSGSSHPARARSSCSTGRRVSWCSALDERSGHAPSD